jgi:rhamnosyl/mannosyltransferase
LLFGAKGKKVVVTYHCDIVRQKKVMMFYKPFLFKFLEIADRILVTSPNILQSSKYLAPFKDKCVVVPLSIPVDEYAEIDQSFDVRISQGEK